MSDLTENTPFYELKVYVHRVHPPKIIFISLAIFNLNLSNISFSVRLTQKLDFVIFLIKFSQAKKKLFHT